MIRNYILALYLTNKFHHNDVFVTSFHTIGLKMYAWPFNAIWFGIVMKWQNVTSPGGKISEPLSWYRKTGLKIVTKEKRNRGHL